MALILHAVRGGLPREKWTRIIRIPRGKVEPRAGTGMAGPRGACYDAPVNASTPQRDPRYEALYRRNLDLARQVDHLSILREVSLAVAASLELSETLPVIVNVVQGALDVRRVTIFELDGDGARLRPVVARYGRDLILAERLEEESEARHGSPLGRALDSRSVLIEERAGRAVAYVPLLAKEDPLGVLVLEDPRDGAPFSGEDAALFRQLAVPIALAIQNARLYALAVFDGLTGLYVRRYFDLRMEEEFAQGRRYGRAFSVLLFDIDHFKKFNDTHGHQTGDAVLRQFAALLRENTRESDTCCRYGGEEMAIILPETALDEAGVLANKLCDAVRRKAFTGNDGQMLAVTTSVGVAEFCAAYSLPSELLQAADEALYEAKRGGRDRVELAIPG
jgi:diguanylate cyclase (GGDEF)-like protein